MADVLSSRRYIVFIGGDLDLTQARETLLKSIILQLLKVHFIAIHPVYKNLATQISQLIIKKVF